MLSHIGCANCVCDIKCRLIVVFQILDIIISIVAIMACFCITDILLIGVAFRGRVSSIILEG